MADELAGRERETELTIWSSTFISVKKSDNDNHHGDGNGDEEWNGEITDSL